MDTKLVEDVNKDIIIERQSVSATPSEPAMPKIEFDKDHPAWKLAAIIGWRLPAILTAVAGLVLALRG